MRAGDLDRRITIQEFTSTINEYEEPIKTWSPIAEGNNIPAQFVQSGGREIWQARQENAEIVGMFKIRFISGLNERQRISYNGRYYQIFRIEEINRGEGWNLYAQAFPEDDQS